MSDRSRATRVRFDAETAPDHWQGCPALAAACDKAGCTDREAEIALLASQSETLRDLASRARLPYPTARRLANAARTKLARHLNVNERAFAYWKQVMDCQRNRRAGKGGAQENAGLLPWLDHGNYESPEAFREVCAEPRNHREIPGAPKPIGPGDFQMDALAFLQVIAERLPHGPLTEAR